jgi:two-component system, cell cycle sensor histidine kinase and response regulator CckA
MPAESPPAVDERLRALVATLPLVVYTAPLDPDPRPRYISPKVEELLGIPADEFTFDRLRDGVHPDDSERALAAFQQADAAHGPLTLEYRFVRPDGRIVWIEDNSAVVILDGEPLAQGYLLDVTERKLTEQRLARDAALRRRVADIGRIALEGAPYAEVVRLSLEAIRDGIDADVGSFLEEVDGRLVVTHAFGWEAVGAVAGEGTPAHTAFHTCSTSIGPVEIRNPDSLMARLGLRSTIAVPVATESGPCAGVFTIHVRRAEGFSDHDVSLVEQTAHLVASVAGREQLEQRLRTAQRLEAVGQLAAGIAHDFNNLLQAISGYTELALAHADEPGARYLQQVAHASKRADELTSQLLAYSRKQDLRPTLVQVANVVTTLLPMVRPLLGDDIRVETSIEDATVLADEAQLENALINLASNARDAMPRGGTLRIETSTARVDDTLACVHQVRPGDYAAIRVVDNGEGMPPDVRERMFEPFFTTKERGKGTGLGLASVFGTVRQMNGFVSVESAVDQGTTMTVLLPLVAA